jgi:hypothetical protein
MDWDPYVRNFEVIMASTTLNENIGMSGATRDLWLIDEQQRQYCEALGIVI